MVMELRYGKVFGNGQGRERRFYRFTTKGSLLTDNNMLIDCNLVVEFLVVSVGRVRALR